MSDFTPHPPSTVTTPWVKEKDEWIMVFGGEFPGVGTVLECEGELVQVIGQGVRVTRGFGGGKAHKHENLHGTVTWNVAARPMIAVPDEDETER